MGRALASPGLCREIHSGLQFVENWNSANTVLNHGKNGALTGPDKEHSETSMLALHVLQSALVHVNTLLLQQVLAEPAWAKKLSYEDRREQARPTAPFHGHHPGGNILVTADGGGRPWGVDGVRGPGRR
ncbi:Tn3 family transposase [Streptomyces virginiae]|uniref:Tn3 family transposase n=1 Tax=Streptomyces virginiae TaxID=1961 RepID=UPI003631CAD5